MRRPIVSRGVLSLVLLLLLSILPLVRARAGEATGGETVPAIREHDLRQRLAWLASEELQGREAGEPGAHLAGEYIAEVFRRAGLRPAGTEGYFQSFPLDRPTLGEANRLVATTSDDRLEFAVEESFHPFSVSPTAEARGSLLFAGFGITAPRRRWKDVDGEEHQGWDDYAGIDARGRIVLVLRKDPGWKDPRHAAFLAKLANAREHGAAGLVLVNDSTSLPGGRDVLVPWGAPLGAPIRSGKIPFVFLRRQDAEQVIAAGGLDGGLAGLEKAVRDRGPSPRRLDAVEIDLATEIGEEEYAKARNVIGLLPGTEPELADQVVVVGAHYDHVGLGRFGSLAGPAGAGQVHPGADDNASGTSAVLELVDDYSAAPPRRPILFLAFTGEEKGLLGSRYFVAHPTIPLTQVVAMVNLDMVGRCNEKKLNVGGVGTARGLRELVEKANEVARYHVTYDPGGTAPTDSTSFFRKKVPVLFFFTGIHEDYHRPTDTFDRVCFDELAGITRFVADVVTMIADADERLVYTEPPRPPRPPLLGIQLRPEGDERGVPVGGVLPGGPAATAGLQAGDVIVDLAGRIVRTPEDLRAVLVGLQAGKGVGVTVLRGAEAVHLDVVPVARGR